MSLSALYRTYTYANNQKLFKAMEFHQTISFDMMVFAQNLLVDGEALYRSRILDLQNEWPNLPGVQAADNPPFPFRFSADEVDSINEDVAAVVRGMELMQNLRQSLGELWPEKGIVRPEQYDQVKRLLRQAKIEMIDQLAHSEEERIAWERSWPYD